MDNIFSITQYLDSIFTPTKLTSDNIAAVLTETRNKLAILIEKIEKMIADGTQPPINVNLDEAKKFLRLTDDALELVRLGIIDSKKLLEYVNMNLSPRPGLVNVSPDMAASISAAETARIKLEKENQFIAGALITLNILIKMLPLILAAM